MTDDRRLLIECYRSGQISEAAWQEHLAADPELRALYGADDTMVVAAALVSQIDADFTFDGQRDGAAEKLAAVKAIGDALSKARATCAIQHRGTPDPERDADRQRKLRSLAEGTGKSAQRARRILRKEYGRAAMEKAE